MRNHKNIIRDAGAQEIAGLTAVSINTVRSWVQRDSIPSEYWASIIAAGHCDGNELILSAASKRAAA